MFRMLTRIARPHAPPTLSRRTIGWPWRSRRKGDPNIIDSDDIELTKKEKAFLKRKVSFSFFCHLFPLFFFGGRSGAVAPRPAT